jgi:uncharacterized coiled-coil protein SlyX
MPWVDISHAAFTMGISERTIRNWIKSGKLNAKTENGRRVVEIPDEELHRGADTEGEDAGQYAGHSMFDENEDESSEGMLDTQKRLEVALLECGRVKGTLASQERVMETLSSNIAELTAKLQKSQNRAWKLIMACLAVAFLGVIVVLARNSMYEKELSDRRDEHRKELTVEKDKVESVRDELQRAEIDYLKQEAALREELKEEKAKALAEQEQKLEARHEKTLATLEKSKDDQIGKLEATIQDLREDLESVRAEKIKLEAETEKAKANAAKLADTVEAQAAQLEKMEEYKTRIISLQDELDKLRKKDLESEG